MNTRTPTQARHAPADAESAPPRPAPARRVEVVADVHAVPQPLLTLVVSLPATHNDLERRRALWEAAADELTRPLREAPPGPSQAAADNLRRAVAATEAGIADARARLATAGDRAADAVAEGKDPSAIDAEAQRLAAGLAAMEARLGPLKAKLAQATRDASAESDAGGKAARRRLRAELLARLDDLAGRLDLSADLGPQLDGLLAVQAALSRCGP